MYRERISKIQCTLNYDEGALITSGSNMFYLSGMKCDESYIIVTREIALYITDFRYLEAAEETIDSCKVIQLSDFRKDVYGSLIELGIRKLFLETENITLSRYALFQQNFNDIEILGDDRIDRILKELRMIKSPEELKLIRASQQMTDDTFKYILDRIKEGRTELEVMLDMEFYIKSLGSEGVSFDFIVISGVNSSRPHGIPTSKKIQKGDFIIMDFGAVYKGYRSDMTRTVSLGRINEDQKLVYDTTLHAQLEALSAVKSGLSCNEIDRVARIVINEAGFSGCFGHGLGHAVGIDIHEYPAFNTRCTEHTVPGMVMTVEPGIYLEGKYGVRIEDMVYITDSGCINLTKSPKELIVL